MSFGSRRISICSTVQTCCKFLANKFSDVRLSLSMKRRQSQPGSLGGICRGNGGMITECLGMTPNNLYADVLRPLDLVPTHGLFFTLIYFIIQSYT